MNRLVVSRQPDLLLNNNTSCVMAFCNFGHFYLVSKISQNLLARAMKFGEWICKKMLELEPLNLMSSLVVMSRQPD